MSNPVVAADSRLDQDTLSSSPAASGAFPISNLFDDRIFTVYKTGSVATEVLITTDAGFGNTADVDYLGLVGHDLSDPNTDSLGGVTLEFQNSFDGVSFSTILTISTVLDNRIIFRKFAQVTDRFFRLRLTRASSFVPAIGQTQWGKAIEFPIGFEPGFDPQAERIRSASTRSQSGNILGSVRLFTERTIRIRLRLILDSFIRDETADGFQKFWDEHASLLKPFFFAWNPGNPGVFEQDALFAIVDGRRGIRRRIRTQLDVGFRDIEFAMTGLKES